MDLIVQFLASAIGELSRLSLVSWVVLVILALAIWSILKLSSWVFQVLNRSGYTQQFTITGSHSNVADNVVWMLLKDRERLGVRPGEALLLSWKPNSKRAYELKLTVRDRMRRTGVLHEDNAVIISEGNFSELASYLGLEAENDDSKIELPVNIRKGWWPGDHPDPSVKMGFWITVWVTLITTLVAVIIELVVP